jgi:methyl-accepting chemotaxis protein
MSMDEVTQQNAALVEEAAAAAQSLTEQAAKLAQLMARFEVREESAETALVDSRPTKHRSPPPPWSRPGAGLELKRANQ